MNKVNSLEKKLDEQKLALKDDTLENLLSENCLETNEILTSVEDLSKKIKTLEDDLSKVKSNNNDFQLIINETCQQSNSLCDEVSSFKSL